VFMLVGTVEKSGDFMTVGVAQKKEQSIVKLPASLDHMSKCLWARP